MGIKALASAAFIIVTTQCSAATLTATLATQTYGTFGAIDMASAPGDAQNGYVLNGGTGKISVLDPTTGQSTVFLSGLFPQSDSNELQVALSLTFAPDYATSGLFYVSYATETNTHVVAEYARSMGAGNTALPSSRREILRIEHGDLEQGTHFGGDIAFSPVDGNLYVTTGDSDLDAVENALFVSQDPSDLRGKVLRIDPSTDFYPDDPTRNYTPAAGNPDFGEIADPAIWALGLRNPFKAAFDPVTGGYLIADVGEDTAEEINLGLAGANYGWPVVEGTTAFINSALGPGALADPEYSYGHGTGTNQAFSITGGEVYYGGITALDGQYVFGDYVTGGIWSIDPSLPANSQPQRWDVETDSDGLDRVLGFGFDGLGNLYVSDAFSGRLYRIDAATVPLPAAGLPLLSVLGVWGVWMRRKTRSAAP
jgi:DNA-binding beta-propeller fold protein YncE